MSYTPLSVYASLGLMQNQGMDLSYLNSKVSDFNSTPFSSIFNQCVTKAITLDDVDPTKPNKTLMLTIGSNIMPGMMGTMPSDYTSALGSDTLCNAATTQANKIFPSGDISSFVQNFGKSSSAAGMTNDLLKAAQTLSGKGWSEFGGGISKISDVATCGLAKLSQVAGTGLPELGAQLSKLGSSENLAELTAAQNQFQADLSEFKNKTGNSVNVAKNLLDQGAGAIGGLQDKLKAAGLPVDENIADFANNTFALNKVTGILDTINKPADIEKLKATLNMDTDLPFGKASDLLDPTKSVPAMKNFLDTEVYQKLPSLLAGIPGADAISDPKKLGEMLQKFTDVPASSNLDSKPNFVQPASLETLKSFLPPFDDTEVGITTQDLIGVVSGGPLGSILAAAKDANNKIAQSTQGQTILSLLSSLSSDLDYAITNSGPGDFTATPLHPTPGNNKSIQDYKDALEAQMQSITFSGNALLTQLSGSLGDDFGEAARKLSNQITGLSRMNIDLTQVSPGNKMTLIGFGRSLGDIAKQPGNEEILMNMCSNSDVGEAIKLHIIEKKNLSVLERFGVNPPNIFPFA